VIIIAINHRRMNGDCIGCKTPNAGNDYLAWKIRDIVLMHQSSMRLEPDSGIILWLTFSCVKLNVAMLKEIAQ